MTYASMKQIAPKWAAVAMVNSFVTLADNLKGLWDSYREESFSKAYLTWLFFPWGLKVFSNLPSILLLVWASKCKSFFYLRKTQNKLAQFSITYRIKFRFFSLVYSLPSSGHCLSPKPHLSSFLTLIFMLYKSVLLN